MKKRIPIIILTVLILIIVVLISINSKPTYDYKIHFFSVGKADAILMSKNGRYIMIDTATENMGGEIMDYFEENEITKLDYLIITHFDKDHVGSASRIIDNVEIGEVLQSNIPKESEYYNNYLSSLNSKNITPKTITDDYKITLDDIEIIVYGPKEVYTNNESNNSSLITTVKYENNKFLFMGDAQNPRIKDFLEENNETFDFLKVPYHGKYLKNLDELLNNKNIKTAVITSSDTEQESQKTIDMLNKYKVNYYLTRNGEIDVLSNGKKISIEQKKK